MSVTPRGKGHQVYVKRGDQRFRLTAPTLAQGEAWEEVINACLDAGKPVDLAYIKLVGQTKTKTLAEVFDLVKADQWKDIASRASQIVNANDVCAILGAGTDIGKIDIFDVDRLVKALEAKGNSDSTINRKLTVLGVACKFALDRKWRAHPLPVKFKRVRNGRVRFLSEDEERTMLSATCHFGYAEYAALFEFLLDTGCRISEALKLTSRDVTATHVTFWETKNGKPRTIPLTARAKDVIATRLDAGRKKLFPYGYHAVWRAWGRVQEYLGHGEDKQWVIHILRHTCASRRVQAGMPIDRLQKWLGHSNIAMTQRYAHLRPDDLDQYVDILDAAPVKPRVIPFERRQA